MAAETAERLSTRVSMREAITIINAGAPAGDPPRIGYTKLRSLAVEDGEFTTIRDGEGRGFRTFLLRDEVNEYERGGLPALRKFRVKKGRKVGAR
jgi:hypothetical protein